MHSGVVVNEASIWAGKGAKPAAVVQQTRVTACMQARWVGEGGIDSRGVRFCNVKRLRKDEQRHKHACEADEQEGPSPSLLNKHETDDGEDGEHACNGGREPHGLGVGRDPSHLQNRARVVHHSVDRSHCRRARIGGGGVSVYL